MCRILSVFMAVVFLGGGSWSAIAKEPADLKDALALQEAFQEAIEKAEPSIACVLVSRSDIYRRWFGETVSHDNPGKLGAFHPEEALLRIPAGDLAQKEEFKKTLEQKFQRFIPDEFVERELKRKFDLADPAVVPEAYGSGVVIDENGLILTNYHVIRDAAKVYVRLPGGKGSYADIHAASPRSDLAVLRLLDPKVLPLPAIRFGDGGKARKGQIVLSLANPFAAGFKDGSPSASWGIISNIRRRAAAPASWEQDRAKLALHHYETLLQIDARLNLGCSGGALLNLQGEMIGLTTALAAVTGVETAGGYAIPINPSTRAIIATLERGEEVSFGFLGVGSRREGRRGEELQITVIDGSPAQRAGLQDNDAIVSVNGIPVRDYDELFVTVSSLLAGTEARLEVRSPKGDKRTVTAVLDKLYVPEKGIATRKSAAVRGLRVDYTSVLYQRDRMAQGRIYPGVYVCEVQPGSPADAARLEDAVVTEVNGQAVRSPADFYRAVEKLSGPLELTILNRGETNGPRKVKLE